MVERKASRRGFFLSLDGPDGGGKTTQVARLAEWLRQIGNDVVACRDPGSTKLGDRMRSVLLDRDGTPIGMRAEMLLYMASRAQLVEEIIRPAIDFGKVVICDRFLLANVVYQGYAGGLPVDELWTVGLAATGRLMPDLTLVLDVPTDLAKQRVGPPRDRMEDRPESYRAQVRVGYLEAAKSYPARITVVDATADPESVFSRLQNEVTRALGERPRS
jgi:dTMP kinase